jgi:hypothetical protein
MALDTVTLTATIGGSGRWVLLTVDAPGMTQGTVYRVSADGKQAVRGAFEKDAEDTLIAADYEMPQNKALTYVASVTDGIETRESALVTVDGVIDRGADVLFGLTNPLAWVPVVVRRAPSFTRKARRDIVEIQGRPDPVAVSDVRLYPSGTLPLATLDDAGRIAMTQLLDSGAIIAFSPRRPTYGFDDVWYLSVGDVDMTPYTDRGYHDERQWDLPVQRVAPPPATFVGPAFATWQADLDEGLTEGQYLASGRTWLDLMVGA